MPAISLSFTASALIILLLITAAIALAAFLYRHTVPPIPRGKKVVLIVLRATALSLLFLFLFEPLLRLTSTSTEKPILAVLVDNSKSMTIRDNTGDRAAQLREVLAANQLRSLANNGQVRYYAFGSRTTRIPAPDSLRLDEDATDIASSLRMVAEERERLNIGAAMLISDGAYTLGQNPSYETPGIPVYTIGIGDSTEQKDLVVTKVVTNELVYSETEVPVDVTIKSSGFKNQNVEVVLAQGGKDLGRARVTLQEGTREYAVHLTYIARGEGVQKYSVRVSSLPGELTTANNQRTFFARILKSKLRILILAGGPSPDLAILKQTLHEDPNITVQSLTQKNAAQFYERPLTAVMLDSADCLVFVGFPSSTSSDRTLDLVRAAIAKNTTPILFVNGRTVSDAKLAAFLPLLPFTTNNPSTNEQLVFAEPTSLNHPILSTNTEEGMESWRRLPPIFKLQTQYKLKTEATMLASTKITTIVLNEPLIAIRNVNKQKSLAILGYGIWRWRLMAQGNPQTERLFSTFLSNSIRWLTTRDDTKPVKVTPTKPAFARGEQVEFIGQVYDANANPVEDALVKVTAVQGDREFVATLRPIANGRYEGVLEGLEQGDYTYKATASFEGQPLGEDNGRFSIGELNLEYQDTRMNAQLLRQIAARSGGAFFLPSDLPDLGAVLSAQPTFVARAVHASREFELWNWKYMLALVVALFAIEWFLRKRSGML